MPYLVPRCHQAAQRPDSKMTLRSEGRNPLRAMSQPPNRVARRDIESQADPLLQVQVRYP